MSNCPSSTFFEPSNIKCSKRCAKPVRPGRSLAEPTWYHMFTDTTGTVVSRCRITVNPLARVNWVYGTLSSGADAGAGVWARIGNTQRVNNSRAAATLMMGGASLAHPTVGQPEQGG